jgi:Fic family protein
MDSFDKIKPYNALPDLPPNADLETIDLLKLSLQANKLLAELKGFCQTLPNPNLLLNTIVLQESKESNAIENIVTTQDELYKATLSYDGINNPHAKEVLQYRKAMYWGLEKMQENKLITTNILEGIMKRLRNSQESIRSTTGTRLANPISNEIIYTPPEGENIIRTKLAALEQFINNPEASSLDPLIKMALIHYQFEAIHPFTDGNGRTGRILNVLYLIQQNLIGLPVLYLSRYIIQNKSDYYQLLRQVTEYGKWHEWIGFVLKGVGETAELTLKKIKAILLLKEQSEPLVKNILGVSFTRELMDLLFSYPYIKIRVLEENGIAKRQTASVYLQKLAAGDLLSPLKIGKETYYINHQLMQILNS